MPKTRIITLFLGLILVLLLIAPIFADTTEARSRGRRKNSSIELITPDEGGVYEAGSTMTITFDSPDDEIDAVSIHYFSRSDTHEEHIIANQAPFFFKENLAEGTRSFNWRIPAFLGESYDSYKIVLRAWIDDEEEGEDEETTTSVATVAATAVTSGEEDEDNKGEEVGES